MVIAFPKRFAKAIMSALRGREPCCAVCGDSGKWPAGFTGLFDGRTPVYEVCTCKWAAPQQPTTAVGADTVLLDWIDDQRSDFNHGVILGKHFIKGVSGQQFHGDSFRSAIGAAIALQAGEA